VSSVTGVYFAWKKNIEHQALLDFNQKQIEQSARDQEEYNRRQRELTAAQEEITRDLKRKTEDLDRQMRNIDGVLNSAEAKKSDRASSAVLQQTVEQLARGAK
jgi:hypothetical protein